MIEYALFSGGKKSSFITFWFSNSENESVSRSVVSDSDPMDWDPPGSSVRGILQARILEWVAVPVSKHLPDPGIKPGSPALQADLFTMWATREGLSNSEVLPKTVPFSTSF